jgi:exopolyphosphatase/guanosine-5'-triphosphate,3'-diphosphate pyrophosphatase
MRKAAIDLGTNTCLILACEDQGLQSSRVLVDGSRVVRLGEGVDQKRLFQPQAMERVLAALREYAEILKGLGIVPDQVICVATSQARDARNSKEFFDRVRDELGFRFQTLSGEEEARLTFLGALLPEMDPQTAVVLDIGGGSTELISVSGGKSLDLGSVRFTERFFLSGTKTPVTDLEVRSCQEAIDQALSGFKQLRESLPREAPLVGVAGTVTTLAAWFLGLEKFDFKKVDGLTLSRGEIHHLVEELKRRTGEERRALPGMDPLRADVILAGALILWRVMECLDFPKITVSTRGLRYGVISAHSGLRRA